MSGEKAHRARVVSRQELRRRAVESARARCSVLKARLAELADVVEGTVSTSADVSTHGLETLRSLETELHSAIRDATAALELQKARSNLKVMVKQVDFGELQQVSLGVIATPEASEFEKNTSKLLERLSEVEDPTFVESILSEIQLAGPLAEPQQKRALVALSHSVTLAVKKQRIAKRCRADAYSEAIKVAHLDDVAGAFRDRAADIKDQAALTRFRAEVAAILDAAEKAANARFIAEQAQVVMEKLGYTIEEPFEFVEVVGDGFLARRADLPLHAIQISVDTASGVLQTRVVADDETSTAADRAAEELTCGDAFALTDRLSDLGVESEPIFQRRPGELPIERVHRRAGVKKKRGQPKEMGLDR